MKSGKLFAAQPLARKRRYSAGAFSFNVKGGRCEACKGAGNVEIEMIFMADVYVQCDACRGTRYRSEMLEVRFKGRNVAEVSTSRSTRRSAFSSIRPAGADPLAAPTGRSRLPQARTAGPDPVRR